MALAAELLCMDGVRQGFYFCLCAKGGRADLARVRFGVAVLSW